MYNKARTWLCVDAVAVKYKCLTLLILNYVFDLVVTHMVPHSHLPKTHLDVFHDISVSTFLMEVISSKIGLCFLFLLS